jgi:hypothetical protein
MKLYSLAVVALVIAAGSSEDSCGSTESIRSEIQSTEDNQQRLIAAVPPPRLSTSLERKNLVRRLERINTENLVSYVYLVSQTGKVMAFYTVDGKVTSLNAYLTGDTRPAYWKSTVYEAELPDYDGAYGKNADGVFFFTTEGVYVEWAGDYLWSDQPLKLTQQPELIYQVKK